VSVAAIALAASVAVPSAHAAVALDPRLGDCTNAQVEVRNSANDLAGPQASTTLRFRNASNVPCALQGFVAVTLVDGQGRTMRTRQRDNADGGGKPVLLAPGQFAHVVLSRYHRFTDQECPTQVRALRVALPQQSQRPVPLRSLQTFCKGEVGVGPFMAGPGDGE
jgi:hypothetical protein